MEPTSASAAVAFSTLVWLVIFSILCRNRGDRYPNLAAVRDMFELLKDWDVPLVLVIGRFNNLYKNQSGLQKRPAERIEETKVFVHAIRLFFCPARICAEKKQSCVRLVMQRERLSVKLQASKILSKYPLFFCLIVKRVKTESSLVLRF